MKEELYIVRTNYNMLRLLLAEYMNIKFLFGISSKKPILSSYVEKETAKNVFPYFKSKPKCISSVKKKTPTTYYHKLRTQNTIKTLNSKHVLFPQILQV